MNKIEIKKELTRQACNPEEGLVCLLHVKKPDGLYELNGYKKMRKLFSKKNKIGFILNADRSNMKERYLNINFVEPQNALNYFEDLDKLIEEDDFKQTRYAEDIGFNENQIVFKLKPFKIQVDENMIFNFVYDDKNEFNFKFDLLRGRFINASEVEYALQLMRQYRFGNDTYYIPYDFASVKAKKEIEWAISESKASMSVRLLLTQIFNKNRPNVLYDTVMIEAIEVLLSQSKN